VTCLTPAVPRSSSIVTALGLGVVKRNGKKNQVDRKISVNYKLELPMPKQSHSDKHAQTLNLELIDNTKSYQSSFCQIFFYFIDLPHQKN